MSKPLCADCPFRESRAPDWIVELEPDVFLAEGDGDPPRTMFPANARVFASCAEATAAIEEARRFRPFARAAIVGRRK